MPFATLLRGALLGASLLFAGATQAQQPDSVFNHAPHESLDLAGAPQFALFDPAFYQNKLFLLGESHGVQRVQEVDFALLRHLNQRAGVRTYLAEVDCAQAFYLNEYLRTGDEPTLSRVFASWVAGQAQWANADFQQKIRHIRQFNQTLPAARRIRFVGIDGVQDYPLMVTYLAAQRAAGRALPPALAVRLDSVAAACGTGRVLATAAVALRTQQALQAAAPAARRALGAAYELVQHALTNLGYARTLPEREAQLLANYQAALPLWHLQNEKLYGLWGLGHVLQSPALGGYRALAARIRQSTLPGHDAVASILCTYSGCQMMTPSAGLPAALRTPGQLFTSATLFNHDGPLVRLAGIETLKAATPAGGTTLWWLGAPGAAAQRLPAQVSYAPGVPAGQQLGFDTQRPATDYVQYVLLLRDSPATQPLVAPLHP
jgi:hypothetical protein